MPIILDEDLPEFYATAVKKGQNALEKCFRDQPEDDFEFRPSFQVEKVEFIGGGMCHIEAGEDPSSPDVIVPNPGWGHPLMELFGGNVSKMVKTKRFHTKLEFVIRKLSGVVGIVVTKTDYQKIAGKKHVKKKRKRREMEFGAFSFFEEPDEESEDPTWSIPGLDKIHSRGELASIALDIEDVVADEAQNMLTISFKRPLRAFAQKSQNKDGEITFQEVDPTKDSQAGDSHALGKELLGMAPRTMKMKLYFDGDWEDEDPDMFEEDEGKACFEKLKAYLATLQEIHQQVEKKREVVASFQKRQDEQKTRKFCDLPASSYARKAVQEFDLDITETGCWDPIGLEEEWKAWYDLRKRSESALHAEFEEQEEQEEEEEEFGEDDEDFFESPQFRKKMLKDLRKDYAKALKAAGCSTDKAQAAAKGLYINFVNIVEDGDIAPRTCTISVRIFSAVGKARLVDLEHEHHARARMSFCEEHAYIKAQVKAFDPETGAFQVMEDNAGSSDNFMLFNMDCDDQSGLPSYSLATAKQAQKLAVAIFGQKSSKSVLSDRDAFRVFMMAVGADAHPFTEMNYDDFCPLSYLDQKFRK